MSLTEPLDVPSGPLKRPASAQATPPEDTPSFMLGASHKTYKHQFANIYFVRLRLLRGVVEKKAKARWKTPRDADSPQLVPRVLDVVKSQLCYIIGTVYMDMQMKPNVMEDVGRDRSIPAPPERAKYHSPDDAIMLEDESGRVQLVGEPLRRVIDNDGVSEATEGAQAGWGDLLVTGVIMAALGRETASGEFEVKDVCFAGIAPMMYKTLDAEESMDIDEKESQDDWIALVSGFEFGETSASDFRIQMLVEYLSGEVGGHDDQASAAKISRLLIAGNSLAPIATSTEKTGPIEVGARSKRFGLEASNFSLVPTNALGDFLLDAAQAMPVHLLAGASDPSGILLPQQPLPRAMFGDVKSYNGFSCETNPVWLSIESPSSGSSPSKTRKRSILAHSGQSVEDMYKYVPSPPTSRLDLACATLEWRHAAPTAPDTLWCYPYFTADPFVMRKTPDLYIVGCQPEFGTRLVSSDDGEETKTCRVVLVPEFKNTGTIVLVNLRNLDVETVEFGAKHFDSNGGTAES